MYVCMCVCMHACIHTCMYVRAYVCMYVCVHICGPDGRAGAVHRAERGRLEFRSHTHTHTHTHTHRGLMHHSLIPKDIAVHLHALINTKGPYTHAHAHTHTHTHTPTHPHITGASHPARLPHAVVRAFARLSPPSPRAPAHICTSICIYTDRQIDR